MAKIDWQMEDVVMPGDMNQIGQEINENKNSIDNHINNKSNPHEVTTEQINKLENNAFTETDRLTDYPVGYTLFYVNSGTTAWPILGSDTNRAIVETMKTSDPQIGTQRITVYSNASASTVVAIYERAMDSLNEATSWGAWHEIATSSDTEQINNLINNHINNKNNPHNVTPAQIGLGNVANVRQVEWVSGRLSNVDLNNYDTTGIFALGSSIQNAPNGFSYGILQVLNSSTDRIAQVIFSPGQGQTFIRYKSGTTWGSWRVITPLTAADVGLSNVTNNAQLKIASNLGDLNNVATARSNLGLTGNSNTTHYHDSRYVPTRVSGGKLQFLDGGVWKDVSAPMTVFQGDFSWSDTSTKTVLSLTGAGVLYGVFAKYPASYVDAIADGVTIKVARVPNSSSNDRVTYLKAVLQPYYEPLNGEGGIVPVHFKNSLVLKASRYNYQNAGNAEVSWIGAKY